MKDKKVCIIGAGSSGIVAAKTLFEKNITFDCYEKGSNIGGNWRFNNDNGTSSSYKSLHINTNRQVMAYSDYPMPDHFPMFPHHSHIISYFEDYVQHFGIADKITFNMEVTQVRHLENGTFKVNLANGKELNYDYVIVANGHHWNPRYPDPAFPGTFTGETLHSHYYKVPEQIRDKNVLVVGIGNSAVDIACEAARQYSGKVTISTRSGAYITPNWIWSIPFDNLANNVTAKFPLWLQRKLLAATLWLAHGNQEDYGVPKPKRPLLSEHPTLSQDLLNLSGRGMINFKPNIKSFEGKTVMFDDGTSDEFDIIIYATGYKVTFPFLKENKDFDVENSNDIKLYRKMIHPSYPNIFFLGLIQPLGAIMPLAEVQSKWIAKLIMGKCKLPTVEKMQKAIAQDQKMISKRYKNSPRHTLQVDFHPYKALIEHEIKSTAV
jgi:dimethylaniline monooxygenase (N-oxide forming)